MVHHSFSQLNCACDYPNITILDESFVNRSILGDIVKGQESNEFVCPIYLTIVLYRLWWGGLFG